MILFPMLTDTSTFFNQNQYLTIFNYIMLKKLYLNLTDPDQYLTNGCRLVILRQNTIN